MATESSSTQPCDYFLHKAVKRLNLIEDLSDNDEELPLSVDSFLCAVVEVYKVIGELTSADKQQVSAKLSALREMCVKCNHEVEGGAFDGVEWKCTAKAVFGDLSQTINQARCRQILRQLQMCDHNLSDINTCEFIEIVITNFRRLLGNTARLLEFLYKYIRLGTIKGKQLQDALLLCSLQLQKCFPLLLQVLEKKDCLLGHCHEAKEYLVHRMKVCLHKVQLLIEEGNVDDTEEDLGGGLFILHMDQALSFLAVFDTSSVGKPNGDSWHDSVQKVLQHAMLIAKVASPLDYKMICGSSEKILRESENLLRESKMVSVNTALCKLHANTLSNALEELEQRVCAAVLRLYLQVFSEPFRPLKELCLQCLVDPLEGEERKSVDLCNSIGTFDSHSDCITQVALFAIACSNDEKRVLGIKSCLASLESLEPQLVPALTSLYLRQGSPKWDFAQMLVQHWNNEIKELWKLIDGIIDPAALAQVTHDAVWMPASILKKSLEKQQVTPQEDLSVLVQSIVKKVSVFVSQLKLTFEELSLSKHSALNKELDDLLRAVREGEAVLLLIQRDSSAITVKRVLKRCELLVSCVQRIQPLLEDIIDSSEGEVAVISSELNATSDKCVKRKGLYSCLKLNLPSDIELDISDAIAEQKIDYSCYKTPTASRFATSLLYKEQSVARTPITSTSTRGSLRTNIFSRKKYPPNTSQNLLQETLCLDVTNILESLGNPSPQTLYTWKETTNSPLPQPKEKYKNSVQIKNSPLNVEKNQNPSQFSSCSSYVSGDINTPERLQDLLFVQERIDAVKLSSVCSGNPNPQPLS